MKQWYEKTMTKVVQILDSDISLGLTEDKIKNMREIYGENTILKPQTESILNLIIDEVKQLWIVMSVILITMLFYNKLNFTACFVALLMMISLIFLINGDYKEEKSLMAIDNLNTPFSYVKRNGKTCKINCEEIVVGDIVFLEKGNYVPADIRILQCEDLKVKEVAVTGEKYEVEKYSMKIEGEVINLSEIKNIVFKSSVITEGTGLGIVIATGMNTQIGKIIKVLLEYKNDNRVFSKRLTKILNKVSLITILSAIITLIITLYKKFDIREIVNSLIFVFMTFSPAVIIIILFLFFNIIFLQFKKRSIYIKNVSAIYFLSSISTIFTKKIGAISENRLIFREVYCDNVVADVQSESLIVEDTLERIMSIALLCNDAKANVECGNSVESLAEHAILKFYNEKFIDGSSFESNQERILKIPYDSEKRIKTVVNRIDDRYRANVKGVLDSLLNKCTHILINGVEKEIKDTDIENIINVHIQMSNKAYNVIALGYRNFNYEPSIDENIESNLVFVGLMGFENPIKESSFEAIKTCKEINIRPIIDEEDNKLASFAFGKLIGLTRKKEEILSGIEINYMSKDEFEKNISRISIFSKISPKHKREIVNSLNHKGHSIASVGDTLTDLEYLNNSQVSISVGSECSNVVRKLSSLFLKENDFSEIINLIKHSKKIVNYISELSLFLSSVGLSEIFIILVSLVSKGEMPFSLMSFLYLNFTILPSCGLAILLQNRNTKQNVKNIKIEDIRKISIKNSFIITVIYFFIFNIVNKIVAINLEFLSLSIFALYQNIVSFTLFYEKKILKNKISYSFLAMNLLSHSIFILYLLNKI